MLSDEELLAELRREFHAGSITRTEFGQKIGVSSSTLHRLLAGKTAGLQQPTRAKIRAAFPRIAELDRS